MRRASAIGATCASTEWERRLSRPEWRILQVLIGVYPKAVSRGWLADESGQSATSSGFANNLGALRSLGLLDYPSSGMVAATEPLFPALPEGGARRQVEAGERSLRAGTQQPPQGQGLWARCGLERPAYEGRDDLGEPCELRGHGTRPTGPLDWDVVECQWCRARVRVHVQCDERVQQAFPQVDCPRCGRVWPDWWQLGAGAGDARR